MGGTEHRVDPVAALSGWAAEDAEGRVMTIVEDPSFADWVPMVVERLRAVEAERDRYIEAYDGPDGAYARLQAAEARVEALEADLLVYREWRAIADRHPGFLCRDSRTMAEKAVERAVLSPVADTQQEQPHDN